MDDGMIYEMDTGDIPDHVDMLCRETTWIRQHLECWEDNRKITTDSFGEIKFVEYGGKIGKYVRVDVDTKMDDMKKLMFDVWRMKKPSLLISVTGGGDNFEMSDQLKETFKCGLMKTALTTGAWIITGGTHAGLTKDVGEAVNDFTQNPVATIGIVPWGCVQNREKLVSKDFGAWPAYYEIQKETNPKESFLDPNHSHFILVDNATEGDLDSEIPFRVKLEEKVAEKKTDKEKMVPTVLLVLAGGIDTLKIVHEAIKKNIPAVIVKGSGRLADILAYAYQNAKEIEVTNQGENSQKKTRRNLVKEMVENELESDKIDEHMTWIKECLDENDLLSVFELDNTSGSREFEVAMLQALLKANKNTEMDHMRLALEWNIFDVAKPRDIASLPKGPSGKMMTLAIQLHRTDFVKQFIGHGLDFLTKECLVSLYNGIPENICLLRTLLNEVKGNTKEPGENRFSLLDVARLIRDLIGDYYRYSYISQKKSVMSMFDEGNSDVKYGIPELKDYYNRTQDLFIWSVLMIRQDMAKLFWAKGNNAIAGALVANSLLKAMKKKTEDAELAIKMQEHIDEWSKLAIGVFTECHFKDKRNAMDLLLWEIDNWDNATCMLIAVKADNNEFIYQISRKLYSIWMGKLAQENNALKLLMCTLFPPLALWLVKYHSPSSENDGEGSSYTPENGEVSTDTSEQKTLCCKRRNHIHSVRNRFDYFFTAPVVIFMYNMMSYSVFLGLFAYILLFNFNPKVSGEEIVLIVWVFTLFTEELRQVAMTSHNTLTKKLQNYITDSWNVLDLITICLFTIGTILRFVPNPDTFEAARLVLALNFLTFFMRLLHLFSAHKKLGPKLVMIRRMVQDLMYFVLILMVFVVSYAIASHAIMFPNSPFTWNTINQMMRRSYWNIYGELFLDEIEGEDDCTFDEALWINGIHPRCPSDIGKHAGTILMGVYMLLANVLLLNLLIAMFSHTFQKIQHNTDNHWFYQRCYLMTEYYTRPRVCPPFIVFSHVFLLIGYVQKWRSGNNQSHPDIPSLIIWEIERAKQFRRKSELKQNQSTKNKVSNKHDRMQMLINNVDKIHEMMNQQTTLISALMTNRKEMQPSSLVRQPADITGTKGRFPISSDGMDDTSYAREQPGTQFRPSGLT